MPYDFESLVGHLHMVGGRAVSAAPPGLLVEVAPRKAARGREQDTFFALVLPSEEHAAPAKFYQQMAQLGTERYFNSSGSVTAGLRSVFMSLNEDLTEHNQSGKRRYEASLLCAVLRSDELIVGRVGSGAALLWTDGQTQPFPAEFSNDDALFGAPLGVHPVPDIKMSRYTVQQGSRLLLADPRLADVEADKLRAAVSAADISDLLAAFKEATTTNLMLMAIEFIPPDAPSPVPAREAETTARLSTQEMAQAAADNPSPVAEPPAPANQTGAAIRSQAQRIGGGAAVGTARALEGASHLLDRIFPPPKEGQRPLLRATTATGAAVLIPVGIVLAVIIMWIGGTGESEFELCVQEAEKTASVARSIASSDVTGTLAAWNAVATVVNRCEEMRPNGDPSLAALRSESQSIVDVLFRIERRNAVPLVTFPNAALKKIVLHGLDLYVLDGQNQWVYRVSLAEDGRRIIPDSRQPIAPMRLGAAVGEFRVGSIFDIRWSEDTTEIVAIDNTGVMIGCSPRFSQSCEAQRLLGAEKWNSPVAFTIWQGKLYILDPAARQIWRYEPSGGTYANAPSEYFVGQTRPDLVNAVDFGIDDKGNIYILSALGEITKWRGGEQTPFAFVDFPEPLKGADGMFLNNDPTSQGLFLVSRATRTIYETSLAGTFAASYRAANEDDFALIAGAAADASQNVIYVLSGNAIFALDRQG